MPCLGESNCSTRAVLHWRASPRICNRAGARRADRSGVVARCPREALFRHRRERRAVGWRNVDGHCRCAPAPRRAQPVRRRDDHRVADATSEQAAIWQWTEISGGDGARSLPDSAVGLAQFDLQVTANRRLLTAAIDHHEIDTRAGHVRFHADARYRHGIAGDDFGVQEARADLPREHQREQCRQADHHPGAEGAARSRQL